MRPQCSAEGCPVPSCATLTIKRGDGTSLELGACYRHYAGAFEVARKWPDNLGVEETFAPGCEPDILPKECLHVGSGPAGRADTHHWVNGPGWNHTRVDIDVNVLPDIVDDMRHLATIESGSYDAVFSSHNLEHLHSFEVLGALRAFHRVLKPNGLLIIRVPDFQEVCERIADGREFDKVYDSPIGPIYPMDMVFGHRAQSHHNPFMTHRTGFTQQGLRLVLLDAGFMGDVIRDNYEVQAYVRKVA